MVYEVYIDFSKWHWLLLIKAKGSKFPFASIEISTPNMFSIERGMCLYEDYKGGKTYCGELNLTLQDFLHVADRIVEEMDGYSLFSSNCQHFCNNLLHHYNFEVYPTTLGKEVTAVLKKESMDPEMRELLNRLSAIHNNFATKILTQESRVVRHFASALNTYTGARR